MTQPFMRGCQSGFDLKRGRLMYVTVTCCVDFRWLFDQEQETSQIFTVVINQDTGVLNT